MTESDRLRYVHPAYCTSDGHALIGKARTMELVRQHQFPFQFSKTDTLEVLHHTDLLRYDREHVQRCMREHLPRWVSSDVMDWFKTASYADVLNFLTDLLRADTKLRWSGFRVTQNTVHARDWTYELFARDPASQTAVYTGVNAPNVRTQEA